VVSKPDSEHATAYKAIAAKVSDKIEDALAARASGAPRIVMD